MLACDLSCASTQTGVEIHRTTLAVFWGPSQTLRQLLIGPEKSPYEHDPPEVGGSLQDPFQGADLSASGLRQVALYFESGRPEPIISGLIGAPNLEHLELEFPSISDLHELSLQISHGNHNRPFSLTLVASRTLMIPPLSRTRKTQPLTLPLDWKTLEQGFGPQDYTNWQRTGLALHPPLVRESDRKSKRIYCNQAYTAAARARTPRLAVSPQSCEFKLFCEEWWCDDCEGYREQKRINRYYSGEEEERRERDTSYYTIESENSDWSSEDSEDEDSQDEDSEDEDF